ncbi:MAG: 8-amino-7-oxononanoate synthase [Planctomycetes bacterium]|nr:8-amino-7-oxononanoate synthase [Planctomycetota bacterium]
MSPAGGPRRADAIPDAMRRRIRTFASGGRAAAHGLVNCASNDYLGLAADPRLAAAMTSAAADEGAGAGAARLVTGARPSHARLERAVAGFTGAEAALLVGSGYSANVSLIPVLAGRGDLVVSDALNHASLVDGCRLSRADVAVTPHRDMAAVRTALARDAARKVLVTEGVFSMDGDSAPVAELAAAARDAGALLVVDDAHGVGVVGPEGRGSLAAAGLAPGPDVLLVGTFGKAFGSYGAFVAWTRDGIDLLLHRLRGFVFSTALPPAVAAAASRAIEIAGAEPWRRERALALAARLRARLTAGGIDAPCTTSAIVPVVLGDPGRALAVSAALEARGFLAPAIRPPTVPDGSSRLRLTMTASHTEADVDALADALLAALAEAPCG